MVLIIENVEDLDIIMPMYNLLEYSKNYSKTSGSLWNYFRDEANILPPVNPPTLNSNGNPITNSASFTYKNSFIRKHQTMIVKIIM